MTATAHPTANATTAPTTTNGTEAVAVSRTVRPSPWRLLARTSLTSALSLLAVLAIGLTTPPSPTTVHTAGAASPSAPRLVQPVTHTAAAFAPADRSLQCRRSNARTSSDRAGYQIDLIINQPDRADTGQRRPLVISCTRSGRVGILACTTTGNNRNDHDIDLKDLDLDGLGLDQLDPADWGLDRRDRTGRIDLRDLQDILNQRASTWRTAGGDRSGLGGLALNGLDINIGGLVRLRNHNDREPDNRDSDDRDADDRDADGGLLDLFPDTRVDPINDATDPDDRRDRGQSRDHSRRTGVCRWIAQR